MNRKVLFLTILSLLSPLAEAREGVTVRGGGDDTALEFTNAFHAAVNEIDARFPDLAAAVRPTAPEALLSRVSIFVEDQPLLVPAGEGTQESVAVNEPATLRIWINRARWRDVGHTRIREAIALHEVLSLSGAEGTGRYPISAAYLAKFNLRNDAFVFVAGRDPSLPEWKRRRMSCERVSVFDSSQSGPNQVNTEFSLVAEASWKVLNKTYSLSYEFGTEEEGRFTSPRAMSRVVESDEGPRGAGRLYRASGNVLINQQGKFIDHLKPPTYHYLERLADGRLGNHLWDERRREKKELVQATAQEELADGSTRTISEVIGEMKVPPLVLRSQKQTCVSKKLDGQEWIALAGEPALGIEVEKLNARAVLVSEADRAYRACTAETCGALKKDLEQEARKFEATWEKIYKDRVAKVRARRYTPEDAKAAQKAALAEAARGAFGPLSKKQAAPKAPAAKPKVVSKPTWIKPRRSGGAPILRLPGQTLEPSATENAAIRAIEEFKRRNGEQ
jgi:hypothetical protein